VSIVSSDPFLTPLSLSLSLSLDPKGIDGKIAHVAANSNRVSAIQAFQTRSALEVTGLIEPDHETWTKLLAAAGETTP
jgi:hypothetical protein